MAANPDASLIGMQGLLLQLFAYLDAWGGKLVDPPRDFDPTPWSEAGVWEDPFGTGLSFARFALNAGHQALLGVSSLLDSQAIWGEDALARSGVEALATTHHLMSSTTEAKFVRRTAVERVWSLTERIKLVEAGPASAEAKNEIEWATGRAEAVVRYGADHGFWTHTVPAKANRPERDRTPAEVAGERDITARYDALFNSLNRTKGTGRLAYRYLSSAAHMNVSVMLARGRIIGTHGAGILHSTKPSEMEIMYPLHCLVVANHVACSVVSKATGVPLDEGLFKRFYLAHDAVLERNLT